MTKFDKIVMYIFVGLFIYSFTIDDFNTQVAFVMFILVLSLIYAIVVGFLNMILKIFKGGEKWIK